MNARAQISDATDRYIDLVEYELHRMMVAWPYPELQPALVYDTAGNLAGLAKPGIPLGGKIQIIVPARPLR